MGSLHDKLVQEGHAVDYLCNEDVPSGLKGGFPRFSFPFLIFLPSAIACACSRTPYDIINVHEPTTPRPWLRGLGALGRPVVVVTKLWR